MAKVQHILYSRGAAAAIADVESRFFGGGDFISSSLKYQHPIYVFWEQGHRKLQDWEENPPRLTCEVYPSDFIFAETRQPSRTIFLRDLGHPIYRLGSPLPVVLEVDGPHVVAYSHDLDIFGWGDVEDEALNDFKASVCELFESLREDRASLGPHLQKVLRHIEQMIIIEDE